MDRDSRDTYKSSPPSASPTPAGTGRSGTARINKSARHASSNPSFKQAATPSISDDQSLTSFPSLSPSLESPPRESYSHADSSSHQGEPTNDPEPLENAANRKSLVPSPLEGLFDSNEPSGGGRFALFEDGAKRIREVPGNLHCQPNNHIKHLASRVGPIHLIKQLAGDLARRDADLTLLQRRAEQRERLLRKMLREFGMANLDIEKGLRHSEGLTRAQHDRRESSDNLEASTIQKTVELGTRPDAPMEMRLSEALGLDLGMQDDLGHEDEAVRGQLGREFEETSLTDQDAPATVRRISSDKKRRAVTKPGNWKSYFRSNRPSSTLQGPSRQMSSAQKQLSAIHSAAKPSQRRKGLNTDVFRPPPSEDDSHSIDDYQGRAKASIEKEERSADNESVTSSSSMASWALKLVAGQTPSDNTSTDRRDLHHYLKGRTIKSRDISFEKDKARQMRRVISGSAEAQGSDSNLHQTSTPVPLELGATMKRGITGPLFENVTATVPSNSPNGSWDATALEAGPVEMDTIHPSETRPPTLTTYENHEPSPEYLTDRFGFIYDQRRRRRQNEAAATLQKPRQASRVETLENHRRSLNALARDEDDVNVENADKVDKSLSHAQTSFIEDEDSNSRPKKQWQDYLQLSKLPTELLSHTPLPAPITSVVSAEARGESDVKSGQNADFDLDSVPRLDLQSTQQATRAISEAFRPATNSAFEAADVRKTEPTSTEPVQALLSQLNELHDSIQKDRTVRWNEFLRKVRAERNRNSEGATLHNRSNSQLTPEMSIANGEVVGVSGLGNKGKVGRAKWNEFKSLVLGGIPVTLRAKIWAECSGASSSRVPGHFKELIEDGYDDPVAFRQIQMDITRTLTDNIFFRKGQGVSKLQEVLFAYARRNPDIGYCQGMNMIAANLLLIMPTAEDAFWILTSLIENILPEKYYDHSLLTSRADQLVLRQYVGSLLPQLSQHLEALGVELEALSFQWFLSVFTDCLSAEALFRVWDVLFCINDGAVFLFQVALALLKLNEQRLLACESPADIYGYINQRMTDHAISIDGLIKASDGLGKVVKKEDVEKKRKKVVEEEIEVSKQRKAARKQKGKAIDIPEDAVVVQDDEARPRPTARIEEGSTLRELEMRTPMPIDEEASWRA